MTDSSGLMGSVKRLMNTMLDIVQTRLELLSNEMEEEKLRIEQRILYGSIALIFFTLSIMLLTVFIITVFWDSNRLLVLGGFTMLYFIIGLVAWSTSRRAGSERSRLFSASLAELRTDRKLLSPPL